MSVQDIIAEVARRRGLDPQTMLRIGQIESGLNPNAQNPKSSAGGLFQFIDSTWGQYGQGQNKMDPRANTEAAGAYLSDVNSHLSKALGRAPEPWETYMGHQQGMGGAAKMLSADPNALASSFVGREAVNLNAGKDGMSVGDFLNTWKNKYGGNGVSPGPGAPAGTMEPGARPEMPQFAEGSGPPGGLEGLFAQAAMQQQTPQMPQMMQQQQPQRPDQMDERRRALTDLIRF